MKHAILSTDGSCLGNPGPGGWACLLRCGSVEKEISGTDAHTTNNRMELQAVRDAASAKMDRSRMDQFASCARVQSRSVGGTAARE